MINTHENNEHYTYEVWALGYDAKDECTDTEIFLGKFETPTEAIEHAKNFYDLECFTGKPDHPDYEDLYLEEGEYLEVQVQKVAEYIPELEVNGPQEGKLLVVGWGGTYGHLLSAVQELHEAGTDVSFAHFDYIMPLPKNTEEVFSKFEKILVCELNSGHFVNYLRGKMPQFDYAQFNKVQGQPFLVQEITAAIKEQL